MGRLEIVALTGALLASGCESNSGARASPAGTAGAGGQMHGGGGFAIGGHATGGVSAGDITAGIGAARGSASSAGATNGGSATGGVSNGGSAAGGAASFAGSAGAAGARSRGGNGGAAAGAGGASQAACAKAIFCDDFESYETGKAPAGAFRTRIDSGAISIDETQHVSGTRSVKFTTVAKDGTKTAFLRLEGNSIFPVTGNAYYARMMFFLDAAPTGSVHWTFIQAGGTIPGQTFHALYRYGGQQPVLQNAVFVGNQLMANYETPDSYAGNGPRSDCWHHANQRVVPVGKWSCIEWKFDGPSNQMRLWLDGAALDDLSVNGVGQGCVSQSATYPWSAPTFEHLEIGWESYQNDAMRTLFVDDLVISREPIGCP